MFSVELCAIYNARNEERTKARAAHSKLLESMNDLEKIELLKGEKGKKREVLTMASEVCVCIMVVQQTEHANRSHQGLE